MWCKVRVQLNSFDYSHSVFPALFVEKTVLFSLNEVGICVENLIGHVCEVVFLGSLFYFIGLHAYPYAFPGGSDSKESAVWETWVQSLGWEDPLEKGMPTNSSILAWRIPWEKEPGGLQFMGCKESNTTEQLTLAFLYVYFYASTMSS